MAKKRSYSSAEKQSWKAGFKSGLKFSNKKDKKENKNYKPKLKKYGFLAFNDNCDVFNVTSSGRNRDEALKKARKRLKFDPAEPSWEVRITEDGPSSEYFRTIDVDSSSESVAGWTRKTKFKR